MNPKGLNIFDGAIAETDVWIREVMEEMGLDPTRRHRGYSALRSVLHAIRDHLSFQDGVALAASLPPVLRGLYLEGWKRGEGGPLKERTRETFLAKVAEGLIELADLDPERAARAVFTLLSRRIEQGRMPDFDWPQPLKGFWPRAKERPVSEVPSDADREDRAEQATREIRTTLDDARREGVPERELPLLTSRKRVPRGRRSTTDIDVLDKAVQKINLWLKDLDPLLQAGNRRRTFDALQAVLLALRDRLTADEGFHLGAQLPMILRGYYFEGWDPEQVPVKERTKEEFLMRVASRLEDAEPISPEGAARAVFALLACRITEGELEDIRGQLPEPVRDLWPMARPVSPQRTLMGKPPSPARGGGRPRARIRKARKEIRSSLARARAEGVAESDLPVLMSRRDVRKTERAKGRGSPRK